MPKFKSRAEYEAWKSSQKKGKEDGQESATVDKQQDTLAQHLREQKLLKLIKELFEQGKDIDEVTLILNEKGYRSTSGDIWTYSQVKQFIAYYQKKKS
ncbi:recombinase family protein [candidate division CSSED10-310 bacterium]|uniref:Recombinase family protein n=1 Tax=candidate division CSSED10-310 bacterium TaxID=2855610 RepID=A0ABV6YWV4_UNCC1